MTLFSRRSPQVLNLLSPTTSNSSNTPPNKSGSFKLIIVLESSPIILYGSPQESTGFIISGILKLQIDKEYEELQSVTLSLVQTFRYSKTFCLPSVSGCKECRKRKTTLARWDVLTDTAGFAHGVHGYPFSHLLPGSLPPTSKLGSNHSDAYVKYELIAEGTIPGSEEKTTVRLPLHVSRSVLRGPDRNSLRVFPPTEVSASAVLPNVIYPKSIFPIELKLDNIVSSSGERRWRMRKLAWRIDESTSVRAHTCSKHAHKLKSAEEHHRKSPPHTPKAGNLHHSTIQTNMTMLADASAHYHQTRRDPRTIETTIEDETTSDMQGRNESAPARASESVAQDFGITVAANVAGNETPRNIEPEAPAERLHIEETRTVSHGEVKSGWKSDFSGRGRIEMVANISTANFSTGLHKHVMQKSSTEREDDDSVLRSTANVACDIDDSTLGVFVNHTLVVEMVVAEEIVHAVKKKGNGLTPVPSNSESSSGIPTGAARVLRMQFKVVLTERSGLGIAWDDEVPPSYEDVRTLSPPTYQDSATSTPVLTPLMAALSPALRTPRVLNGVGLNAVGSRDIQELTL